MCEFVHFVKHSSHFFFFSFSRSLSLSLIRLHYLYTHTPKITRQEDSVLFILTIKSDKRKNKIRTQWLHGITLQDKMTEPERAEKGMNKRPHNTWQAHASIC